MGAKVIIFCKFLISKFLKGLTHSAMNMEVQGTCKLYTLFFYFPPPTYPKIWKTVLGCDRVYELIFKDWRVPDLYRD